MKNSIKNLTLSAVITAIICVSSMLSLNVFGVSFSLALFGVFLSGLILTPLYAFITNTVYIIIGIVGLPVFANFNSGLGAIFGPSGGFILSYPIVALSISFIATKVRHSFKLNILNCCHGLLICYLIGTVWYCFVYDCSFISALLVCVAPFVVLDLAKIFLSCYIVSLISKYIKK